MTLQEIKLLHAYDAWANNRIFDSLATIPAESYSRDMKSSHGGIHGTMVHLVGAQKLWLERWTGVPTQPYLRADAVGSLAELKKIWSTVGHDMSQWLGTLNDRMLQDMFTMKTVKGETFSHIYWQSFQHVVNHSTHHRGQVVALMRQLGFKPPNTDLIAFYRETGK